MKKLSYFSLLFLVSVHASTHKPQEFLDQIKGSKTEGQQIYQHFCVNCHAEKPLIPLAAPRFRITKEWSFRLKQDPKLIFKHTNEGMNAMPPRGGCFECTDEQLWLAIVEMLPKEAQKPLLNELSDHKKHRK